VYLFLRLRRKNEINSFAAGAAKPCTGCFCGASRKNEIISFAAGAAKQTSPVLWKL